MIQQLALEEMDISDGYQPVMGILVGYPNRMAVSPQFRVSATPYSVRTLFVFPQSLKSGSFFCDLIRRNF